MKALTRKSLAHRIVHPALIGITASFCGFAFLAIPELTLLAVRHSSARELTVAAALVLCAALLWSLATGAAYFSARILHVLVERARLPLYLIIPGAVVFLLLGYPAARWVHSSLDLAPIGWILSIGSFFASASVVCGIATILMFPSLQGTTGMFALSAAALSRTLLLPFESRLDYGNPYSAALLLVASLLFFAALYALFRTRFAHQTAGVLQVQRIRRGLAYGALFLVVSAWAGYLALALHLPERLSQTEGAAYSLLGIMLVFTAISGINVGLHVIGLERRLSANLPLTGRSGYWFLPACLLFAVSSATHIISRPPEPGQAARLRVHGLLSYDLWALTQRLDPDAGSGPGRRLKVGTPMRPELALSPAPRGEADTIILLSVLGANGLPGNAHLQPTFLGTDKNGEVTARLMNAEHEGRNRLAHQFVEADYRTVCGGWDGGRGYLQTGPGRTLHGGCQVHMPLDVERVPTFRETVELMLRAHQQYREKRTLVWIHYEAQGDLTGEELEHVWTRLASLGRVFVAVTERAEPSMAYVSLPVGTGRTVAAIDEATQPVRGAPENPIVWSGQLAHEYRPSPLLVYRAALGRLPRVLAQARGDRMQLWDPAGKARWERQLMLPARAAGAMDNGPTPVPSTGQP